MLTESQMSAIIRLTEQHDHTALTSTLLQIMRDLLPADELGYYEIYNNSNDLEFAEHNVADALVRNLLDGSRTGKRLGDQPGFVEAVLSGRTVNLPPRGDQGHRSVIPVTGARYVIGLLVVSGEADTAQCREFIQTLVRIFGNMAMLVRQKEHDALTGLLNRPAFEQRLHRMLDYSRQRERRAGGRAPRLCLAMVDIDHFKQVNDEWGHMFGDEVLLHFSRLLTGSFRYYDIICRHGGEEFVVVLNDVGLEDALRVVERFRRTAEAYHYPQVGTKTCSIGVVEVRPGELLSAVIDKADQALYYAKSHGRNRVCAYEHLLDEGRLELKQAAAGDVELF